MQLNVNNFFSDRLVWKEGHLEISNSWTDRIFSSKKSSDENSKTICCFRAYLNDALGKERLDRICSRYGLDLIHKEIHGKTLYSRNVAEIVVGARDVRMQDISNSADRDAKEFAAEREKLANALGELWKVPDISEPIFGHPTEWAARFRHDPFLSDRERLQLCDKNGNEDFETFAHALCAYIIRRETDVGMLIPAPNRRDGVAQFYCVKAKIISRVGMVSYILGPATQDTELPSIRVYRSTAPRAGEIAGLSSLIADLEPNLGQSAHLSSQKFNDQLPEYEVVMGHSLGSVLAQKEMVDNPRIKKAYLYNGPGILECEVEKFNRENREVELFIRDSNDDFVNDLGQVHLGCKAPANVKVHYHRYYLNSASILDPHVGVVGRGEKYYGIEGVPDDLRDARFYRKRNMSELVRQFIGLFISLILRVVRFVYRLFFGAREIEQEGLQLGSYEGGKFSCRHIKPDAIVNA